MFIYKYIIYILYIYLYIFLYKFFTESIRLDKNICFFFFIIVLLLAFYLIIRTWMCVIRFPMLRAEIVNSNK